MTSDYSIGQVLNHPEHGECEVTFVGDDYVGIEFPGGQHALLRKESFTAAHAAGCTPPEDDGRDELPWPDNTFTKEPEGVAHYMGSHWQPFYDDPSALFDRLPEISGEARVLPGLTDVRELPRTLPEGWSRGAHCFWPSPQQGIVFTLRVMDGQPELCSVYPFTERGTQALLELDEVVVRDGGVEAQIKAYWEDVPIDFFDTQFLTSRLWYECGRRCEFMLTGFAYRARPATEMEMPVDLNPDQVAWEAMLAGRHGDDPPAPPKTISLAGMGMFVQAGGGDADEYSFRGAVQSVQPFTDFLGQSGWRLRVAVIRIDDDKALDLEIVVTARAWGGSEPPMVGQDVEGNLWLQGRLWHPGERACV